MLTAYKVRNYRKKIFKTLVKSILFSIFPLIFHFIVIKYKTQLYEGMKKMKLTTKITAVIMSLVLLCTITTPAMAIEKTPETRAEYVAMIAEETGSPALTTAEFLKITGAAADFFRLMTNGLYPTTERINVSFDEFLLATNHYVLANSGLDIVAIISAFPPLNINVGYVTEKLKIDTVAMRDLMYALRDECHKNGMSDLGNMYHFIGAYMSIIDEAYFYAVPTKENEKLYELCLDVTFRDGYVETFKTGVMIDTVTGELYGKGGNGIFGIGFNFNFNEMLVYALVNAWHRDFGFAVVYDIAANALPIWDIPTRRFYFEYDGLEWLIQTWKGSYFLVATGAEVGVYNRVPGEELGTFYNCATDDQLMMMTMKLSHKDTVLVDVGPEMHWWINGFKMNGMSYEPESLTLEFSIEMPDMEMLNAFTKSIDNEEHKDTTYTVSGTTVSVVWHAE